MLNWWCVCVCVSLSLYIYMYMCVCLCICIYRYICHAGMVTLTVQKCLDVLIYVLYLPLSWTASWWRCVCFIRKDLVSMRCKEVVSACLVLRIAPDSLTSYPLWPNCNCVDEFVLLNNYRRDSVGMTAKHEKVRYYRFSPRKSGFHPRVVRMWGSGRWRTVLRTRLHRRLHAPI
jgi:hypothetical protein